MINIRPALPEELPQLKDLWRKCFGDPSAYVDIFFQKFCSTDQVLVVDDDGEVDSMAAMLPGTIQLPDGTDVPVGYVYALATNPYMQGKGHARQLLKVADDFLRQRGDKAMVLVPASPSLHRFFEAIGMDECFATRKVEILTSALTGETGGGVLTPISPRENTSKSGGCWPRSCSSPPTKWPRRWRPSPRRWRPPGTTSAPRPSGTGCPAAIPRPSA